MTAITQARLITVTTIFADQPQQRSGFGPLIIADQANGTTLDGDRVRLYTSYAGVQTDNTAGFISAGILEAARVAFSQTPSPPSLYIGRVDTAGAETYADAFTAIAADGVAAPNGVRQFAMVAIESRADADILSITSATEADGDAMAMVQTDDADWLTSGVPAGLAALATRETAAGVYHTTDAQWADVAYMIRILAADPDIQSGSWTVACAEVAAYTSALSATQVAFTDANFINQGLAFGTEIFAVRKGVTFTGREGRSNLSAIWFERRLKERTIEYVQRKGRLNQPIPLNSEGIAAAEALVRTLFEDGLNAGHFSDEDPSLIITSKTVNLVDRSVNVECSIRLLASAVEFNFTARLTNNALA